MRWEDIRDLPEWRLVNEGPLAEQWVGQHLLLSGTGPTAGELFYWLREKRAGNAEVDYVTSVGPRIIPIEVKAGSSGSLKSLLMFMAQKADTGYPRVAVRFDLNPPSRQSLTDKHGKWTLLSLPLYMTEQVKRLAE